MAFYNLPLRVLKLVKETIEESKPIMSMEHAVWRLTGEQADWLGIEAGKIRVGDRADLVVLNPEALNQNLEQVSWGELRRLNKILRKYRRVHQGAPNAANPLQIFEYLIETLGWIRKQ
ncbi:MAG: hypothetical protein ACK5Q1_16725, partial [Limnobacter sp.]